MAGRVFWTPGPRHMLRALRPRIWPRMYARGYRDAQASLKAASLHWRPDNSSSSLPFSPCQQPQDRNFPRAARLKACVGNASKGASSYWLFHTFSEVVSSIGKCTKTGHVQWAHEHVLSKILRLQKKKKQFAFDVVWRKAIRSPS